MILSKKIWGISIAVAIVLGILISIIIRTFLFDVIIIHGTSMMPTLIDNEKIIINKIGYRISEPDYGDVILFKHDENENYIKRIIGKEGDTIEIKDSLVYRNGKVLDEPYISADKYGDFLKVTVPKGRYFVLGDNRAISLDSRYKSVGNVKRENIIGKTILLAIQ